MDGRDGEQIQSVHDMIGRFTAELLGKIERWNDSLRDNPAGLETIESSVHQAFARGAGSGYVGGRTDRHHDG